MPGTPSAIGFEDDDGGRRLGVSVGRTLTARRRNLVAGSPPGSRGAFAVTLGAV
jgi:hypothetical protein